MDRQINYNPPCQGYYTTRMQNIENKVANSKFPKSKELKFKNSSAEKQVPPDWDLS
jgi:hypothetical protein